MYLQTLWHSLKYTRGADISIALITNNGFAQNNPAMLQLVDEVLALPPARPRSSVWKGLQPRGRNRVNEKFVRTKGIDIIAMGEPLEGSGIPALGWIPDFQHRHFPQFFSSAECADRDSSFARIAEKSSRVILISDSARKDFAKFLPQYRDRGRVLRPICQIPDSVYETDPTLVCRLYNLPEKFFFLPGQFWKHKNHITVFRAVSKLKREGAPVLVACSGQANDYREPQFFSGLLQEISKLDIRDCVAFLGVLPRDHVFQLMRQSVAVLNPSLFEGFGMTVDEARCLGKATLLSDIGPHREQNPPRGVFFDPLDEKNLAECMLQIWTQNTAGPARESEKAHRLTADERMRHYADSFMEIVAQALN